MTIICKCLRKPVRRFFGVFGTDERFSLKFDFFLFLFFDDWKLSWWWRRLCRKLRKTFAMWMEIQLPARFALDDASNLDLSRIWRLYQFSEKTNNNNKNRSLPLLHYAIGPCNSLPYSSFRLNSVIWFVCFGLMWINIKTISRISVNCRPQLNATQWYDVCLFIFIISVHRTSICVGTMFDEIFV